MYREILQEYSILAFPCSWSHDVWESSTSGECLSHYLGASVHANMTLHLWSSFTSVAQFILTAYKAGCILQIRWLCSWETVICPRSRRPSLLTLLPWPVIAMLMVNSEDLSADPAHLIRGLPRSPVGLSGEWSWRWRLFHVTPMERAPLRPVEITQCDGKEPEGVPESGTHAWAMDIFLCPT